jgi:hypothetical protein
MWLEADRVRNHSKSLLTIKPLSGERRARQETFWAAGTSIRRAYVRGFPTFPIRKGSCDDEPSSPKALTGQEGRLGYNVEVPVDAKQQCMPDKQLDGRISHLYERELPELI